jgi:hypothetical protein
MLLPLDSIEPTSGTNVEMAASATEEEVWQHMAAFVALATIDSHPTPIVITIMPRHKLSRNMPNIHTAVAFRDISGSIKEAFFVPLGTLAGFPGCFTDIAELSPAAATAVLNRGQHLVAGRE